MDENKNEALEIKDGPGQKPVVNIPNTEKPELHPENFTKTGQASENPDESVPAAETGAAVSGLYGGDGSDDAVMISEGMMTAMLYDQLMGVFGEGTQLFTMEMPGRVLNQLDYAYPMKDYNSSTLTKPYAVAENEFRLTDGMFDLAPIVQGPNGNRLSNTFETLVNNYTPDISNIKEFVTDKMELRLFLMETITDEIDGEEVTCSRIEFCQRMYMRYLKQKYNWDQEKIDEHVKASSSGDLDGYAKWLATTSWTKDQALENLFQDAVIRGFYHEVLTILGFLDVQSPAERLAKAKANRRSSVRRSLDASMEVLPVQLQPSSWFRSLSPNFSPKDMTLDRQYLAEQYQAKRSVLSSLEAELRVLLLNQADVDGLKDMEAQLAALKKQLDQSEAAAFKGFADNMVEAVKLICEIASNGDIAALVAGGEESLVESIAKMDGNLLSALGLDAQTAKKLGKMMYDFYAENLDYFSTYNELLDAELQYARAQTNDYSDQIEILKERIAIISREVAELQVVVASGAVHTEDSISADTLLPGNRYNEDSEFMDIVFGRSQVENRMREDSDSFFTSVKSSMCRFLSSVHAEGEYSLSETSFMKSFLSSDFTIGMRATKVTIDRGGWFDAGILDLTPSYRRLKETISGGAGLSAEGILKEYRTNEGIENGRFSVASKLVCAPDNGTYLLPAVPMSFLVVKDVVMRAKMASVSQDDYERFKKAAFSSSASFMGFRLSGGGAKESFCGLHNLENNESQFVMRIPGPQILGWFQELPAKDKSSKYESLSGSAYFEGIIDSLKTYGEKLRELETRRRNSDDCIAVTTVRAPIREEQGIW
ncbi:MAG: hypothetical protein HFH32_18720 [Eubacterium sp.]|jgi:hypothetical protein|nr:hypothetical protein [Eubacterium sp.]